jgi:hypothetical protein
VLLFLVLISLVPALTPLDLYVSTLYFLFIIIIIIIINIAASSAITRWFFCDTLLYRKLCNKNNTVVIMFGAVCSRRSLKLRDSQQAFAKVRVMQTAFSFHHSRYSPFALTEHA